MYKNTGKQQLGGPGPHYSQVGGGKTDALAGALRGLDNTQQAGPQQGPVNPANQSYLPPGGQAGYTGPVNPNSAPPQNTQPAPNPNPYAGSTYNASTGNTYSARGYSGSGGGSGGYNGTNGIGGVSAVNPQAKQVDYDTLNQNFINPAYQQAMTRLNPQLEQQSDAFDQQMINRGIPVGSEAYNEAKQQMDFNQDDARQSAAFNAMQFGLGAQNQMFGQDATRSGLANSLLQSQWSRDLGYAGLSQRDRQFGAQLGEQQRQFDDMSNYRWDRAEMNDLGWLDNVNFRNESYNNQNDWMMHNARSGMLGNIPGANGNQVNVGGAVGNAQNSANSRYNAQLGQNQNTYNQWAQAAGLAASLYGAYGGG